MSDDWSDHPDAKAWARRVRTDLVPKIQSSAATISIVPTGDTDIKFAVELGLSIMLGKPLILVVMPGTQVPDKLVLIADEIAEIADMRSAADSARLGDAIKRVIGRRMSAPRPIDDDEMAVGILDNGRIALMLPDGGMFEMNAAVAEYTGNALIAAAQFSREVKPGRAQQN